MRTIYFLIARFHTLIIFIVLEIISLSAIYKSNKYQEVRMLNTANGISAKFVSLNNAVVQFLNAGKNNKILQQENIELRKQIKHQNIYPTIDSTMPLSSEDYVFDYIPAKIVDNSINKQVNYITINKGKKEGIQKGQGVVSSNGVVGIITNVTDHFALVRSVISTNTPIGVKHEKSNALGSLTWNGVDPFKLQVLELSKTLAVKPKDTIVTTGYSAIFPPDFPVAIVQKVEPDPTSSFFICNVKLTNSINIIGYVYVVINKQKEEIQQLHNTESNEL